MKENGEVRKGQYGRGGYACNLLILKGFRERRFRVESSHSEGAAR
jgi:hypothetical protein